MPTLRQYLEQTYSNTARPTLPIQPSSPEKKHTLPGTFLKSEHLPNPSSSIKSHKPQSVTTPSASLLKSAAPYLHRAEATDEQTHEEDTEEDTEEEDNTTLEAYYLDNPREEKDIHTVFGKEVRVWESHGGTMYTHFGGEEHHGVVVMPRAQKRRSTALAPLAFGDPNHDTRNEVTTPQDTAEPRDVQTTAGLAQPREQIMTESRPPLVAFRTRSPSETRFHLGSAAIDPLGAFARPLHSLNSTPLPRERLVAQTLGEPVYEFGVKKRRVTSGSFGTFDAEGGLGRFGEREHRLLPASKVTSDD